MQFAEDGLNSRCHFDHLRIALSVDSLDETPFEVTLRFHRNEANFLLLVVSSNALRAIAPLTLTNFASCRGPLLDACLSSISFSFLAAT